MDFLEDDDPWEEHAKYYPEYVSEEIYHLIYAAGFLW